MNKLKEIRSNAGLKQSELADMVGVSRSLVRNIEQGQKDIEKVAASTMYKLTIVLNCSVRDLLDTNVAKEQVYSKLAVHFAKLEMDHTRHLDSVDDYDSELEYYLSECTRSDYIDYLMDNWNIETENEAIAIQKKVVEIIEGKYNEQGG